MDTAYHPVSLPSLVNLVACLLLAATCVAVEMAWMYGPVSHEARNYWQLRIVALFLVGIAVQVMLKAREDGWRGDDEPRKRGFDVLPKEEDDE